MRILVVANRTASAQRLLDELAKRADAGARRFTLLIPDAPSRKVADWTLDSAVPLIRRATGRPVDSLVATDEDPFDAIARAVQQEQFDEIVISTLPKRTSRWLKRDLISRTQRLGLPVTVITPKSGMDNKEALKTMADIGPGAGLGSF
jgi:hypothetical protein